LRTKKDTVGIRVPDHILTHQLLETLGRPILSTSLPDSDEIEYMNDPEIIYETYKHVVDIVINAGIGGIEPSTILDCTVWPPEIVRQGKGEIEL
jgi:translation factor SUA5